MRANSSYPRLLFSLTTLLFALIALPSVASDQSVDELIRDGFSWRNTGPYRAGSWVTDVAVPETPAREHLYTLYVAGRNGGVWKSTNNGTTFTPLMDDLGVTSVGCVAVAPSDANVVWVGTGDATCTRSAYYGDGVYKSTDAGRTWKNMGLKDSQHVSRIIIHPTNPNIVYVAAMGHLFSTNEERGVFKSTDGGNTWKKVLYVDDKTGAIDMVMDRSAPDTIYTAMYECQRRPWRLLDGGPGSGLHKTTDGGNTWTKLEGGFPGGQIGRIGLDLYQRDPKILYAVVDNRNVRGGGTATGDRGNDMAFIFEEEYEEEELDEFALDAEEELERERARDRAREEDEEERERERELAAIGDSQPQTQEQPAQGGEAGQAGQAGQRGDRGRRGGGGRGGQRGGRGGGPRPIGGEVYRSDDAGLTWRKTNSENDDASAKAGYSFNVLRISANDPDHVFITGSSMSMSTDGGRTWGGAAGGGGGGARRGAGARGAGEGQRGERGAGRGEIDVPAIAQGVRRGGGGGGQFRPFSRAFGDFRMLWVDQEDPNRLIAASDGGVYLSYDGGRTCEHLLNLPLGEIYAMGVDMDVPYNIYAGLQDHESWKAPSNAWSGWVGVEHWITTGIGDGMYNQVDPTDSRWLYNNQEFGSMARVDQVERTRTTVAPTEGPAGESLRFNWTSPIHISPHKPATIYTGSQFLHRSENRGDTWKVISPDLTTADPNKISGRGAAIQHCTILTISESPVTAGVIWVGCDDGNVQVTRDGGEHWTNATAKIAAAGGPPEAWVSRVFASPHEAGTAFVSLSRLRQDDFKPYVYKTTDYGATWKSVAGNLPERSVNVVVQDKDNPNLLVVGNDLGVQVSLDGGQKWTPLKGNMPPAHVHDLVIHPRAEDLVVGSYGRGLFVTNIAPLKELTPETLAKPAHLFAPLANPRPREGVFGNYRWYGDGYPTTRNGPGANEVLISYYLKERLPAGESGEAAEISIADSSGDEVTTIRGSGRPGVNQVSWRLESGGARVAPGKYTATLKIGEDEQTRPFEVVYP